MSFHSDQDRGFGEHSKPENLPAAKLAGCSAGLCREGPMEPGIQKPHLNLYVWVPWLSELGPQVAEGS